MAHLEDRLRERTSLPDSSIPRLKKVISGLKGKLPQGEAHHVKLPGGAYAVVKKVNERPILATFLSPDMVPPGSDLSGKAGIDRLREAIKTSAATSMEEMAHVSRELTEKPISPNRAHSLLKKTNIKPVRPSVDPKARLVSVTAGLGTKKASATVASLLRKAAPSRSDYAEVPTLEGYPVGLGEILQGAAGVHPDYDRFLANADPRLEAIIRELKKRAQR
jgi:hypothetical protein